MHFNKGSSLDVALSHYLTLLQIIILRMNVVRWESLRLFSYVAPFTQPIILYRVAQSWRQSHLTLCKGMVHPGQVTSQSITETDEFE